MRNRIDSDFEFDESSQDEVGFNRIWRPGALRIDNQPGIRTNSRSRALKLSLIAVLTALIICCLVKVGGVQAQRDGGRIGEAPVLESHVNQLDLENGEMK